MLCYLCAYCWSCHGSPALSFCQSWDEMLVLSGLRSLRTLELFLHGPFTTIRWPATLRALDLSADNCKSLVSFLRTPMQCSIRVTCTCSRVLMWHVPVLFVYLSRLVRSVLVSLLVGSLFLSLSISLSLFFSGLTSAPCTS